jgi:hypothetical protein
MGLSYFCRRSPSDRPPDLSGLNRFLESSRKRSLSGLPVRVYLIDEHDGNTPGLHRSHPVKPRGPRPDSDGVPVQAYDQDVWANTFRYADADPHASLQLFEVNRAATLSLIARLDPALRANHGLHAERGKETVDHLLRMYAGHDLNHLAQVERLIAEPVR